MKCYGKSINIFTFCWWASNCYAISFGEGGGGGGNNRKIKIATKAKNIQETYSFYKPKLIND